MRKQKKELPPDKLKDAVLEYLEERFGLGPEVFKDFGFYLASKGRVYLGPRRAIDRPKVVTVGLLIARAGDSIKPTTNLLQAFGRQVKKNEIRLSREQTLSYVRGEDIRMAGPGSSASPQTVSGLGSPVSGDGYVLLTYEGYPLGCGLLKAGTIKNMLPKAKRLELKYL
ncbi:MAG: hypothetical protein AB1295_04320 [Candidatus Micrarchaeota archaeon]